MILYHGSNLKISKIDLSKCRPYKDFGKGFYCTTIKKQAEFMAERVVKRQGRNKNSKYIWIRRKYFLWQRIKH